MQKDGVWRDPKTSKPKQSFEPDLIATAKRLHARGRTIEEIALGLDLERDEVEILLAGGIKPRGWPHNAKGRTR